MTRITHKTPAVVTGGGGSEATTVSDTATLDLVLVGDDIHGNVLDSPLLGGQAGSFYLARANHTGTQLAATISDFTEAAQDVVGALVADSATIDATYNDAGNTESLAVIQSGIDHGSIGGLADDDHTQYHTDARALTWLGTRSTSDLPEGSRLYYTDERVDDRVAALLVAGAGIGLSYNDAANSLTVSSTITQYTDEQAQDAVGGALVDSGTIDFTYNDAGNTITAAIVSASITDALIAGSGITTRSKLPAALAYEDEANTFTGGLQSITPASGVQALKLTPSGAVSASVSTGGAFNLDNTGSTGAGVVLYSNQGATAGGRLLALWQDNAANPQQALRVLNDGTGISVSIQGTNTSGNSSLDVVDVARTVSSVGIQGDQSNKGTLKVTHNHPAGATANDDAGAAALRLNFQDDAANGTAAQGLFIAAEAGGPTTTGDLLDIYPGPTGTSTNVMKLTAAGLLRLRATGASVGLELGGDVQLYRSAADTLKLGAGDSFDSPTIITPTIASFTNAQHNHTNAAGGGTLTSAAVSDFTEAAQDVVGALVADSSSIDATYNDAGNVETLAVLPAGVDHGGLGGLADDDHANYAYLLGRGSSQTWLGTTVASGDLTISPGNSSGHHLIFDLREARVGSTSEAQISVLLDTGLGGLANPVIGIGEGQTITPSVTAFGVRGLTVSGTWIHTLAHTGTPYLVFNFNPTAQLQGAGGGGASTVNLGNISAYQVSPSIQMTSLNAFGTVSTSQSERAYNDTTSFDAPTGGAVGATALIQGWSSFDSAPTFDTGWTVTDELRIRIRAAAGAGTITREVGVDIANLQSYPGTLTNKAMGVRSMSPVLLTDTATDTLTGNNPSLLLELKSTTRALLVSRMTGTQALALTALDGMVVYCTDNAGAAPFNTGPGWFFRDNGAWVKK